MGGIPDRKTRTPEQVQTTRCAAEEIDLGQDVKDWEMLTNHEKHFASHVLAFFLLLAMRSDHDGKSC